MRKTAFILSLFMSLSFSYFCPAGETGNLIGNGGFEEWDNSSKKEGLWSAAGYNLRLNKGGNAFRSGEGEIYPEKHSGKFAQYIMVKGSGQGIVSKGVPVKAGNKYTVSIWANVLSGKLRIGTCFAHKPWTYIGPWVRGEANSKWTRYEKDITIPEGCKSISVVLFIQNGSVYFDDLEIKEAATVAEKSDVAEADRMPLLNGKIGNQITRKRIAVFNEPEFPSESPRSVEWYENTLKNAGLSVTKLSNEELCNSGKFNGKKFDTLIIPTGGFFPDEAEMQVDKFLQGGGTVLIDESMTSRTSPVSEEIKKEFAERFKKYKKGEDIYGYMEYLSRVSHDVDVNVFKYDSVKKKWLPSLASFDSYEFPVHKKYYNGSLLLPWPNVNGGVMSYSRPFDSPVIVNPELGKILPELPDMIPADENPSKIKGALRLRITSNKKNKPAEFACDLLVPVYLFSEVSNFKYNAFEDEGKSEKDKETDFYIYRYHNIFRDGGTFIHLGNAGAKLMRTDAAESLLIGLLKLAEGELPGEIPSEYVNNAKKIRKVFSEYSVASIELRELLSKASRLACYEGRDKDLSEYMALEKSEKTSFEKISGKYDRIDGLILRRDNGFAYGNEARKKLLVELDNELLRLKKHISSLSDTAKSHFSKHSFKIKYPYIDRIYWGFDNVGIGRGAAELLEFRQILEKDGFKFEGFRLTTHRLGYPTKNNDFKKNLNSGNFNPETGKIKDCKYKWFEDKNARKNWKEAFRWKLERVAKLPEVTAIYGMEERDLKWSLWGEWPRTLFLKYLEEKHGTLDNLNKCYNAQYENFNQIKLPSAKPETQTEHALWEDWTRFREVYVRDEEFKPFLELLESYAPNKLFLSWGTYNQNGKNTANGINFYEYGKILKVNGFEHSNREDKEFLTFDIASMHSKNITAEWGGLYFPPGSHQDRVDLIEEAFWKGIANGQIGWSLFTFSSAGWNGADGSVTNFYDLMNLPLPTGTKLRLINNDFKGLAHIVLDGKREEAPVRIVYSPTTRRHTSWPSITGDISYQQNQGLYRVFKEGHLHARSIDEQAVQEGFLSPQCKLLIIPSVVYENRDFHNMVLKFLEDGGNVLVTIDSGKFDEYGNLLNSWLCLAGVVPVEAKDKVVLLDNGIKYFSMANEKETFGLKSLFGKESIPVVKFRDGTPAITETTVGKGKLFISGIPLGKDCADHWIGKPEVVFSLLKPVFEKAGIKRDIMVSDIQIMARPWEYEGKKYLFLTDRGRDGIKKFNFSLLGAWNVKDYLLDTALKTEYDGKYTSIEGAIHSPGGVVYELEKNPLLPVTKKAVVAEKTVVEQRAQASEVPVLFDETHPFEGRIWSGNTVTVLGAFSFDFDVETGGGWHGKTYLIVNYKGETLKKLCEKNKTLEFYFGDCVLKVECQEITDVYPVNIKCRVSVEKIPKTESKCTLEKEVFNGHESYVLSNGIIKVRILPEIGGRIINFISFPDNTDHCYSNPEIIMKYSAKSWSDMGGIEENAGGFPGPYWNAQFNVETVQNTPGKIILRLAMKMPVEWKLGYAKPSSGKNSLSKEFILRKDESRLEIDNKAFNDGQREMPTGFRTHPEYRVGGDTNPGDKLVADTSKGPLSAMYPFSQTFTPVKNWAAVLDTKKKMVLLYEFDKEKLDTIYTYSSEKSCNVELVAKIMNLKPGAALSFDYSIVYLKGLTDILEYQNGVGCNIRIIDENISDKENIPFEIELASYKNLTGSFNVTVKSKEKAVKEFSGTSLSLEAGRAEIFKYSSDGSDIDEIELTVLDKKGATLLKTSKNLFKGNKIRDKGVEDAVKKYNIIFNDLKSRYDSLKPENATEKRKLKQQITAIKIFIDELADETLKPDKF